MQETYLVAYQNKSSEFTEYIVDDSAAALSHNEASSAAMSRDICAAQVTDKRYSLQIIIINYTAFCLLATTLDMIEENLADCANYAQHTTFFKRVHKRLQITKRFCRDSLQNLCKPSMSALHVYHI
jgi:hypothetical protein